MAASVQDASIDNSKPPTVELERVSKSYGKITALQEVSLRLEPGLWGLLGPNGSGKSTLLALLAGQLKPTLGRVHVCGQAPFSSRAARAHLGLCPQQDALYDDLSAMEWVAGLSRLSGYSRTEATRRAEQVLTRFELEASMHHPLATFSRGMRQRAKLAQSMVHDPSVLLLDEPLSGTDTRSRKMILDEIHRRAEQGTTVLFSTHLLHEVQALTDRTLLLVGGRLVASGRAHEIRQLLTEHPHHIRIECEHPRDLGSEAMRIEGVCGARLLDAHTVELHARNPDSTYAALNRLLAQRAYGLRSLTSPDTGLEALFHHLVDREKRTASKSSRPPSRTQGATR